MAHRILEVLACLLAFDVFCFSLRHKETMSLSPSARKILQSISAEIRHLRENGTRVVEAINVLCEETKQHVNAIDAARESHYEQQNVHTSRLEEILAKYNQTERDKSAADDRQYRIQKSLKRATWCAFFAAVFYGGVAVYQWREMVAATGAAQQAVQESRLNRQQSEKSFNATVEQFRLEQRAWVGVTGVETKDGKDESGDFSAARVLVALVNSGNTPALKISVSSPIAVRRKFGDDKIPDFGVERQMQEAKLRKDDATARKAFEQAERKLKEQNTRIAKSNPAFAKQLEEGRRLQEDSMRPTPRHNIIRAGGVLAPHAPPFSFEALSVATARWDYQVSFVGRDGTRVYDPEIIYVLGEITYVDVFSPERHRTKFCLMHRPRSGPDFVICPEGNWMD